MNIRPIQRALLSVADKSGLIDLAQNLSARGVELLSTGGTAQSLRDNNIKVTEVSDYTGFPEMMDGRLKTLHPKIHGGILARRGIDDKDTEKHDIAAIDLVVVNLYPFEQTVANFDCDLATAIENIDIGGPTMLRAAAKNHDAVTVLVDIDDYQSLIDEIDQHSGTSLASRFRLASKAFAHTAKYDGAISNYLSSLNPEGGRSFLPDTLNMQFKKMQTMRYGENPHQQAAFYADANAVEGSLVRGRLLQGKAMSYNNVADADAALECVREFDDDNVCVIVKHANPCGVAIGESPLAAYERAFQTDPTSAFGGIIAFNRPLDHDTAKAIIDKQFVEVILAPEVSEQARSVLATKKNVRVLEIGESVPTDGPGHYFKRVSGGLLVQDYDRARISATDLKVTSQRAPTDKELEDLLFAWKVVKYVKSNAIIYVKERMTVGVGAGQMSRVYSAKIAAIKAADEKLEVRGSVLASDAFFPFRDGIDTAAAAGVTAVIEPGGSMRDEEVIAAADEYDMALVFTGIRHFRH